tara:strand:+ start:5041 stop:7803 length:2763 start_codon:yes stop_codon:yes gene_type:complete
MNNNYPPQTSLTSNPDLFSDDAWDLLLASQDSAKRWRHEYLDVEHLIQTLFIKKNLGHFTEGLPINKNKLLDKVEGFLAEQPIARDQQLFIGEDLEELLEHSNDFRTRWGSKLIEVSHIIFAIGRDERIGADLFEELGMPSEILESQLGQSQSRTKKINNQLQKKIKDEMKIKALKLEKNSTNIVKINSEEEIQNNNNVKTDINLEEEPKALDLYGRDLTLAAKNEELDPVIGRDPEIRRVIKVLARKGKNNPVLIGAPGVGKTAIIELLAQRIVSEEVPDLLKGLRLISLDLGALIAGAKFRGQFEERFRSVLSEASNTDSRVILFIDELHTVLGSDRSNSDAGNLLKPLLARGDLRCIGATTPENYQRTVEKDPALNRRFQKVLIKEPNLELSLEILRGIKERYEIHHGVTITDEAVISANRLADRYISDRCLPDKAIDLIDEASAQLKMEATSKPQIIEEAEVKLKKIELALINSDQLSQVEEIQLNKNKSYASEDLLELTKRWQRERNQIDDLNNLIKREEGLMNDIDEAEKIGDLEEAARLQYDQLNSLQNKRLKLENIIKDAQDTGVALLRDQVEASDIADVVSRTTGIPVQRVLAGERHKLLNLEKELEERIIGQNEAVQAVSAAIRRARAGMQDPRRPVGSFLFLGPTGVGKTELAKTLAASLFDEEEALIRLDMSEYMERNAVARLIGAPPGYVGYEEGGQLTESVRKRPYTVLLLDEIEKAHPDVFNLLLQVLDDGRLTDSQGRTVDFRHTIIVMTSNLASRAILDKAKLLKNKENDESVLDENLINKIDEALSKQFRPEFLNRVDEVIRFRPLSQFDLQKIVKLQINDIANLLAHQGMELKIDSKTIEKLATQGYEPEYGARPLRRVLRRKLENPLATKLLEDNFDGFSSVKVSLSAENPEELMFFGDN